MNKIDLFPDNINKILCDYLDDENSIFVFPTDVVMNSWIDWIITHPEISHHDTVAFERFTPWDKFKKDFVSAHEKDKNVIPSILRKMFVADLISKNGNKPKENRFRKIINPDDKYAKNAESFSDWLSKNLQSLHFWNKRLEENKESYGILDDEDNDYINLYNEYKAFLNNNNLFEPAWVENIEFQENKKSFHIFYPEILEDFLEYEDIFEKADNIFIYNLPKDTESPKAYFYTDSRKELRRTMLNIINIVNEKKADWSDIVLSVPDLDTYRPYIQREFELYEIPYVIKAGVSLTKNSAGRIFREIYDCYNSNFSFETVRTLLLDECVPWKDEIIPLKEGLIREGNKLRCICSTDKDIWLRAFNSQIYFYDNLLENITFQQEEKKEEYSQALKKYTELKNFYQKLHGTISAFFPIEKEKNTFGNIRDSWMYFKVQFLKQDKDFSEDANNILSRCIKELSEIIDIENKYKECNLQISSPFSFFLEELDKKTYTKQTKTNGVTIFPYKLSAAGYFKYQFVIDCSQKNLDISYKRLSYLNNNKRKKLKINDEENQAVSEVFIKLYGKTTECTDNNFIHFSAAQDTFNGFAIPHSLFSIIDVEKDLEKDNKSSLDNEDYILGENLFVQNIGNEIKEATNSQLNSFENWKNAAIKKDDYNNNKINTQIEKDIDNLLITLRNKGFYDNNIKITARADLEKFFPCPRKWLLDSVLKLDEDTLDTNLMQPFDMGTLNHKILEVLMKKYIDKKLPYFDENENRFKEKKSNIVSKEELENPQEDKTHDEIVNLIYGEKNIIINAIKTNTTSKHSSIGNCPLAVDALMSQQKKIADNIFSFLKFLLKPYEDNDKKLNGIGGCTVLGVEKTLHSEESAFDYYGVVDCYLLSPENDFIIIDYKNSYNSIPSSKAFYPDKYGILKDFQMPLYYKIVKFNQKREIGACYFYSIKDNKSVMFTDKYDDAIKEEKADSEEAGEEQNSSTTISNLELTMNTLDQYKDIFLEKLQKKDFTPYKSKDKSCKTNVKHYENCQNCTFKTICRTTYSVAGKTIPDQEI